MELETLRDLYVHELKDLYSGEQQLIKALPKMKKAARNRSLAAAFNQHLEQTKRQARRLEDILKRHILAGLLTAPWVREPWAQMGDDDRFFGALQELVAYAYGESTRIKQRRLLLFGTWRDIPARSPNGILAEVQDLLAKYRRLIEEQSHLPAHGGQAA